VAIAARVVGDADTFAVRAAIDVPTKGSRAAVYEMPQDGLLPSGDTMVSTILVAVRTQDVGDLEPRSSSRLFHRP
jgi:hypothetical protein